MNLNIGDKAPVFQGKDQDGNDINLESFLGKKVVLYFYPKDDTPGCTAQACNLRDNYDRFLAQGYEVLGLSGDDEASHKKFREKYNLPFPLVADPDKSINELYGVWVEKNMYGNVYMGTARTTFIIDENGIITDIISKVDTAGHTDQILGKEETAEKSSEEGDTSVSVTEPAEEKKTEVKKTSRKSPAKKTAVKKTAPAAKKAPAKKTAAKKPAAKKAPATKSAAKKKTTPEKAVAKKSTAKKSSAKKVAPKKKTATKKGAVKPTAKKTVVKKAAVKKAAPKKKVVAKKATVKKSAAKKTVAKKVAPKKKTVVKKKSATKKKK